MSEGVMMQLREEVDGCPKCPSCGSLTNPTYSKHPVLGCWKCGKYMPPLTERDGLVMEATVNAVRHILGWDSEQSRKIAEIVLAGLPEEARK